MKLQKTWFAFAIVLLEWYEFTVYNLMIPYGVFGGEKQGAVYIGFLIFALSFLARPLGAIYFSNKSDRTKALQESLNIMSISTLLIAFFPGFSGPLKTIWFSICKMAQGFALGGSYGLSYLSVYENQQDKDPSQTNYKLSIIHMGWTLGMLLGGVTILLTKLFVGNIQNLLGLLQNFDLLSLGSIKPSADFISYGWRIPFLLSGLISVLLYIKAKRAAPQKVELPEKNIFQYTFDYLCNNTLAFVTFFAVISIDMVISHLWFTYSQVFAEVIDSKVSSTLIGNIRLLLLLVSLPIFGKIIDKMNVIYKNKGNFIGLVAVCIIMIVSSFFAPWKHFGWVFISALTAGLFYSSIMGWAIPQLNKTERQIIIGPAFNLAGALVGGTIPLLATYVGSNFGHDKIGWIIIIYATVALISLYIKNQQQLKK